MYWSLGRFCIGIGDNEGQSISTLLVDFVIVLVSGTARGAEKDRKKRGDHHHELGNLREENGGGNDEDIVSIHETS